LIVADLEIRTIDPFDTDAFDAWHATYYAADAFGRSGAESPWQLEELRVFHQADHPNLRIVALAGVADGVVVAAGWVKLPLLDNTDHAEIGVWTHPDHRGRGHGSAMLARIEQLSAEEGRTVLDAEACYPYDAPADGAGHPNADFLVRRGFRYGLGDVNRRLDLPVSDELLAELAAKAAPHHAAYTLRSFVAPVPDDLAVAFAALSATLMTEAPLGELEREPENPDVAVLRAGEETLARQGRTKYTTVAMAEDGQLAGFTDLLMSVHDPGRVFQWGTLVPRAHRGHRLGLALKVANLAFLQGLRPDARLVTTYNAEVNEHMIGVNEQLGFRPVERLGEFQKRL
jgi:RimJ/RimL family protein N-acetyltransferase